MDAGSFRRGIGPIATFLLALSLFYGGLARTSTWSYVYFCTGLLLFFIAFGWALQGTWKGIVVNRRNRWSLTQTVTMLWSVLILGAFLAFWWLRLRSNVGDPLDIRIDDSLLYLMGITTATYGTGAYIHHRKGRDGLTEAEKNAFQTADLRWNFGALRREYLRTAGPDGKRLRGGERRNARRALTPLRDALGTLHLDARPTDVADLHAQHAGNGRRQEFLKWVSRYQQRTAPMGRLLRNLEARQAHPADMLRSEEVSTAHRTDLGKAQMALFTLAAMATFAYSTWKALAGAACTPDGCLEGLPVLSSGFVNILLASSGGYLGVKAVGHPTERWTPDESGVTSDGSNPA